MKLTIHRGANQIGGNCIELESNSSRILLDFGAPLPRIDEKGKMKEVDTSKSILDIPGLYDDSKPGINGIIISHTHQDHFGMLYTKNINKIIPVYMSEIMEDIVRITGMVVPGKKKELSSVASIKHFQTETPFKVGNFTITPYLMDHSAGESFAFVIEAEGKKVIYTGDFRAHGNKKAAFTKFLNTDFGKIDLLITEGTMLCRENEISEKQELKSERDVRNKIVEIAKKATGPVFVLCSGQNIDLITSLGAVADWTNRFLAVDVYIALILQRFQDLGTKLRGKPFGIADMSKDYLKVLENKKSTIWELGYPETFAKINAKITDWDWINKNINKMIIPIRTTLLWMLKKNIKDFAGAVYIYSMWDGYIEDESFKEVQLYFEKKGIKMQILHVSGHAYPETISELIKNKNPAKIVPVHTQNPKWFADRYKEQTVMVENGGSYEF